MTEFFFSIALNIYEISLKMLTQTSFHHYLIVMACPGKPFPYYLYLLHVHF